MTKSVLLQGNEACVEGALAAGMRFFAGYPITPSTEIAERCAVRLPQIRGVFIQMEDEIASLAAVIGASAAGMKAMTATSGPGFSLMQENIGYAAMAEIPCVIADVQRCGPSTGMPTSPSQGDYMQARWGTHGDHPVIAISPSSVSEVYTQVIRCFNLSEKYRTPVIFLMDETIGHMREGVEIPEEETLEIINRPLSAVMGGNKTCYHVPTGEWVPGMAPFGEGERYHITGLIHDESGFPTNDHNKAKKLMERLMNKIIYNYKDIVQVEESKMEDAEIAVVCYGGTVFAVKEAIFEARAHGLKAGMFRPVTVWPFPERELASHLPHLKQIIVAEHNSGQMLLEVQRITERRVPISFIGRIDGTLICAEEILQRIRQV
jgi:2-oxoglutarate ferredoxin oxidoreductase subunit alpha